MLKKLRNNKKKGFTLVELIVVLVILAILAALLIPALTGYIDKAKEKDVIAETRSTVMAAQTLVDEKYADKAVGANDITVAADGTIKFSEVADLAEVEVGNIKTVTVDTGKVTGVVYTKSGKTCTYSKTGTAKGTYSVSDAGK